MANLLTFDLFRTYRHLLLGLCLISGGAWAETVVGFAQDTLANDWRLAQVKQLEQRLARHPDIRFIYTDGMGRTAKQVRDIEDLLIRGVDILITSPRDAHAMTPVVQRAYRRGVPVILLTRLIDSDDYTTFIAPDDAAIARQAAAFMADELPDGGRILMLQGVPSSTTTLQRTHAFLDALQAYPSMQVVAMKEANFLRNDAIKAVEEVLREGIDFNAIYAQSDSMASGARIALRQNGYDLTQLVTVGIDYISEAREAIRRGEQAASFTYPTCAAEAEEAVLKIIRGEALPKRISVPSTRVTLDNIDQVEPIF
ncbi:MAG: substrate-binding domain-containing protein [Pseudomonadota bacterium]